MTRWMVVVALAVVGAILLHALRAEAEPIFCPSSDRFTLSFGTASYNGKPAEETSTGRFSSDAGVEFFATQSRGVVATVADAGETCAGEAKRVTVRLVDPWTGEVVDAVLGEAP